MFSKILNKGKEIVTEGTSGVKKSSSKILRKVGTSLSSKPKLVLEEVLKNASQTERQMLVQSELQNILQQAKKPKEHVSNFHSFGRSTKPNPELYNSDDEAELVHSQETVLEHASETLKQKTQLKSNLYKYFATTQHNEDGLEQLKKDIPSFSIPLFKKKKLFRGTMLPESVFNKLIDTYNTGNPTSIKETSHQLFHGESHDNISSVSTVGNVGELFANIPGPNAVKAIMSDEDIVPVFIVLKSHADMPPKGLTSFDNLIPIELRNKTGVVNEHEVLLDSTNDYQITSIKPSIIRNIIKGEDRSGFKIEVEAKNTVAFEQEQKSKAEQNQKKALEKQQATQASAQQKKEDKDTTARLAKEKTEEDAVLAKGGCLLSPEEKIIRTRAYGKDGNRAKRKETEAFTKQDEEENAVFAKPYDTLTAEEHAIRKRAFDKNSSIANRKQQTGINERAEEDVVLAKDRKTWTPEEEKIYRRAKARNPKVAKQKKDIGEKERAEEDVVLAKAGLPLTTEEIALRERAYRRDYPQAQKKEHDGIENRMKKEDEEENAVFAKPYESLTRAERAIRDRAFQKNERLAHEKQQTGINERAEEDAVLAKDSKTWTSEEKKIYERAKKRNPKVAQQKQDIGKKERAEEDVVLAKAGLPLNPQEIALRERAYRRDYPQAQIKERTAIENRTKLEIEAEDKVLAKAGLPLTPQEQFIRNRAYQRNPQGAKQKEATAMENRFLQQQALQLQRQQQAIAQENARIQQQHNQAMAQIHAQMQQANIATANFMGTSAAPVVGSQSMPEFMAQLNQWHNGAMNQFGKR